MLAEVADRVRARLRLAIEAGGDAVVRVGRGEVEPRRHEERSEQREQAAARIGLRPLLAPAEPSHDAHRLAAPGRVLAEIREDDLLEVELVHRPARVVDVAVRADEKRRLPLGMALAHDLVQARDVVRLVARAGEEPVRRDDLLDRPDELRPARREDDEVVADPLEVGKDVGREHDRQLALRDRLEHGLHELAARERVERGDRLVEEEQLRPLRERERERDLRALPARELPHLLLQREVELGDAAARERRRPSVGLSSRPTRSISSTVKPP